MWSRLHSLGQSTSSIWSAEESRFFAQCVSWCRAEHLSVHVASSMFSVFVLSSVLVGFLSFSLSRRLFYASWTMRFGDGDATFWGGLQLLLAQVSFANSDGQMLNTWRWVDCCRSWDAHLRWPRVLRARSLSAFSALRLIPWERGPTMHSPCVSISASLLPLQLTFTHNRLLTMSVVGLTRLSLPPCARSSATGCKPQSAIFLQHAFLMMLCPLLPVVQTASCMGEAVLLNICGFGVLPVGATTVSPVVVLRDTLASQNVADSVIPPWEISGIVCPNAPVFQISARNGSSGAESHHRLWRDGATTPGSLTQDQSTTLLGPCVHTSDSLVKCVSISRRRCRVWQDINCGSIPAGPSCSLSLLSEVILRCELA